jgi:hypothetical protein
VTAEQAASALRSYAPPSADEASWREIVGEAVHDPQEHPFVVLEWRAVP